MRNLKIKNIIWIIFICFFSVGCGKATFIPTNTTLPPGKWLTNFLSNPVCSPPCWEKITPDQTDFLAAASIIKERKDVTNIKNEYEKGKYSSLLWTFVDDNSDAWIASDMSGEKVSALFFSPGSLALGDIIQKYGDPVFLKYVPTDSLLNFSFDAVYPENNMVLDIYIILQNRSDSVMISPNINVARILLLANDMMNNFLPLGDRNGNLSQYIIKWHGYGSYNIGNP